MSFPSALSREHTGAGAVIAAPVAAHPPLPVPSRKGRSVAIWLIGLLVLLLIGLVGYFLNFIGPVASGVGMVLAVLPLVGVFFAIRVVDRWEPEPWPLLLIAVAWGAVAAVGIALGVDVLLTLALRPVPSFEYEALTSVVQAPVVEELAKGLGVFIIFATARRAFDGPVDGVVYGALVGAGFAFTENIQYFAVSLIEGGPTQTTITFFVRGILSPFAHVMFTSVTGFALGLAARRGMSAGAALGPWALGLAGAMTLHALWNGSAMFGDFFLLYFLLQVPLFGLFIWGIIALRREEARLTRARLGDYVRAGWFSPQEVDMLATRAGRSAGLTWASRLRGDRRHIMKGFIMDATALAAARQRAVSGRDPAAAEDEGILLARTAAARAALFAP